MKLKTCYNYSIAPLLTIPEVAYVAGKAGRADSPLDPAPLSMFEILIHLKSEYGKDENGKTVRQWRPHIDNNDDIWNEITATIYQIPGITWPPKLYPIENRILMLQSGMRSPFGVKIAGNNPEEVIRAGTILEKRIKKHLV